MTTAKRQQPAVRHTADEPLLDDAPALDEHDEERTAAAETTHRPEHEPEPKSKHEPEMLLQSDVMDAPSVWTNYTPVAGSTGPRSQQELDAL